MSGEIHHEGHEEKHREWKSPAGASHMPIDSYSCLRCGRADGLDAVAANPVWARLSAAAGGMNLLCLWCMDELAAELGIQATVTLHFSGRALVGTSQSDADEDHARRLCDQLADAGKRISTLTVEKFEAERKLNTANAMFTDACRVRDEMRAENTVFRARIALLEDEKRELKAHLAEYVALLGTPLSRVADREDRASLSESANREIGVPSNELINYTLLRNEIKAVDAKVDALRKDVFCAGRAIYKTPNITGLI